MKQFDFVKAFYKGSHNRDTFVADVDALVGSDPRNMRVTSVPFSASLQPATTFPGITSKARKVRLVTSYEGAQLYELRYSYKLGTAEQTERGRFVVYEHPVYPNVFVAVTFEGGRFVQKGMMPFLRGQFPHLVVGFVPHKRLKRLLAAFRADHGFSELIVTRATQRLRLPEEGVHRRIMPVMTWPDMALDEAFDWLAEHNGWFKSVRFDAKRDGHTVTRVSLTRDGVISCDYLYNQVFQSFVMPVCKIQHENYNLFSNRARRDNPTFAARPLTIAFDEGQFDDVSENQKLILALRAMRTASISVLHGNPYVHVSAVDYLDGSTFDVWVVDSRELVLVPQMYASVGSIKRLVNHIFDTYAEGEVREYCLGAL